LQSQDIDKLFQGLQLSDSILMTSRLREVLFRKRESGVSVKPSVADHA